MIFNTHNKNKNIGFRFRIFRCAYPYKNPTRKFEALHIQIFKRSFWVFRNKDIHDNWPQMA